MANIDEIAAITAMKHANAQWLLLLLTRWIFKTYKTGDITSYEAMVSYADRVQWKFVCKLLLKMC